jgi:hypothetical protein
MHNLRFTHNGHARRSLRVQVIILRVIRETSVASGRTLGAASRGSTFGEAEVVAEATRLLQVLEKGTD